MESSVRLGVADAIADVVETGSTLKRAGLEMFGEPIMTSEAILVQRRGAVAPDGLTQLLRRLQGVFAARAYVMVDYNVEQAKLDVACAITPGIDFGNHSPERHVRFAYTTAIPQLADGVERLKRALAA